MSVSVLDDNLAYVRRLLDIEEKGGTVKNALSFLSSVYFPAHAIDRFFLDHKDGKEISSLLQRRGVLARLGSSHRHEIYESSALTEVVKQGLVHDQERVYRSTPREVVDVLNNIICMINSGNLTIGLTSEVIPYVYALSSGGEVLIDVKANYSYQRIQGLFISSDDEAFAAFESDFAALWRSVNTIRDQDYIKSLINRAVTQRAAGSRITMEDWPVMKKTDFANE